MSGWSRLRRFCLGVHTAGFICLVQVNSQGFLHLSRSWVSFGSLCCLGMPLLSLGMSVTGGSLLCLRECLSGGSLLCLRECVSGGSLLCLGNVCSWWKSSLSQGMSVSGGSLLCFRKCLSWWKSSLSQGMSVAG